MTAHSQDTTDTPLRIVVHGGVARVTIDNPPLNLLDGVLMRALDGLLDDLQADPTVRVLVVDSADPDFLIAHGDMAIVDDPREFASLSIARDQNPSWNPMMRLHERVRTFPCVTIGVLRGMARGGGAELFTAFDLRYASLERGALAQMEAPTGIIPGAGATAYLPRTIGRSRALEVILTAELVDARTAQEWGWVTRALSDHELDAHVELVANRIARLPPGVAAATLEAVDASMQSMQYGLSVENRLLGELFERPHAALLTRAVLDAGGQTRAGERNLEQVLERVREQAQT